MGRRGRERRWTTAVTVVVVAGLASLTWLVPGLPAASAPGDVGVEGPAFVESGLPTVTMAESKVWNYNGQWYAAMLKTGPPSSGGSPDADVVIHKRVGSTWVPTTAVLDVRATAKQDVVARGATVYVLSHRKVEVATGVAQTSPSLMTRLTKLTFDAATGTYVTVAGFPVTVNPYVVESMSLDVDSAGVLWVTWAMQGKVMWQRSTNGGATWSAPAALTVAHATPTTDDISSVVAFGDRVGIMWGDQVGADDGFWFTTAAAGAGPVTWTASEAAYVGADRGDDHISLKSIGDRVVAAVKTRAGRSATPLIVLLSRSATGAWTSTSAWDGTTDATRPVVVVDSTNERVHLFATLLNGTTTQHQGVYTKSASLAAPTFVASSDGTAAMVRAGGDIADVTSTKQTVTSATGLVALAADTLTQMYWTHTGAISPVVPPSAPASVTAVAGKRSATVSWTAATPGTNPITAYRITADPALPTPVADQPATARGPLTIPLPTGVTRTIKVQAVAGSVVGPARASAPVTPNNFQPFPTAAAFAQQQSEDFLRRPSTPQETSAVTTALVQQDQDGSAVVLGPRYFGAPEVAGPDLRGLQASVVRLYTAYFLRWPERSGLDYWIGQRQRGMSLEQASRAFAASPEFRTMYGSSLSNGGFVDLVYRNLFDRAPDAAGRAYWIAQLERGIPRGRMMTLFSESPEYVNRTARQVTTALVFRWMLDRMPTASQRALALAAPSAAAVVEAILAGPEYADRVAS